MLAHCNALGFGIDGSFGALKGRRIPPPFQGGQYGFGRCTWGVAPGWHPPRRWRDTITNFQEEESADRHLSEGFQVSGCKNSCKHGRQVGRAYALRYANAKPYWMDDSTAQELRSPIPLCPLFIEGEQS